LNAGSLNVRKNLRPLNPGLIREILNIKDSLLIILKKAAFGGGPLRKHLRNFAPPARPALQPKATLSPVKQLDWHRLKAG